jgi:hypothetical protein
MRNWPVGAAEANGRFQPECKARTGEAAQACSPGGSSPAPSPPSPSADNLAQRPKVQAPPSGEPFPGGGYLCSFSRGALRLKIWAVRKHSPVAAPSLLLRPFSRLIKLLVLGQEFEVPENNPLLRCFQYLAPEGVSYGRFCWNEDCQYCRVSFDLGEGTPPRAGLACKIPAQDGMRIKEAAPDIRYALRELRESPPEEQG